MISSEQKIHPDNINILTNIIVNNLLNKIDTEVLTKEEAEFICAHSDIKKFLNKITPIGKTKNQNTLTNDVKEDFVKILDKYISSFKDKEFTSVQLRSRIENAYSNDFANITYNGAEVKKEKITDYIYSHILSLKKKNKLKNHSGRGKSTNYISLIFKD